MHWDYMVFAAFIFIGFMVQQAWMNRRLKEANNGDVIGEKSAGWGFRGVWFIVISLLVGGYFLPHMKEAAERRRVWELFDGVAPTLAFELEHDGHGQIREENDARYPEMLDNMRHWTLLNPHIQSIYTLKKNRDGQVCFWLAPETDYDGNGVIEGAKEERVPLGTVYGEDIPEIGKAFSGEYSVQAEPTTDAWGSSIGAFFPLRNAEGEIDAVLGIDFAGETWFAAMQKARLESMVLVLIGFVLLEIPCLILFNYRIEQLRVRQLAAERSAALEVLQKAKDESEKAKNEAEKANRVKGEFLANMSHELRTPMNAILGMTTVLLEGPLNEEQRELAGTVHQSAEALLAIINDTLDYSKIEAGKMTLEKIEFDTRAVVEATADLIAWTARAKGLPVMTYIDPEIPRRLLGDPGRLRQVFLNLIGNAVKFTKQGEVVVRAVLQKSTATHVVLKFSIMDTGIGIQDHAVGDLFRPFTQADTSMARKYGGTGLGLSIAKHLVELMDGEIGLDSIWGSGSTFWFTASFEVAGMQEASTPCGQIENAGQYRAVIVSDSVLTADILSRYIKLMGIDTAAIVNSNELPQGLPVNDEMPGTKHLLIFDTDIKQPEMIDECLASPCFRGVPLMAVGAREHKDNEGWGKEAYLLKPVKLDKLFNCVKTMVAQGSGLRVIPKLRTESVIVPDTPAQTGPVILLVEDNQANQKLALLLLRKLGYNALAVNNGREAVNAVLSGNYAAVLMDCQMPEMDGFEATAQIRMALMNQEYRIPIIAMTANTMQQDREKCIAAGMDDYMGKPIKPELLKIVLERWLTREEGGVVNHV